MLNPTDPGSLDTARWVGSAGVDLNDAVATFERARRECNRLKRLQAIIFGSLFLLAVAASAWMSEVSVGKLIEGFPGLVAYVWGTLPVMRADQLVADVGEWYWGLGRWLSLLLDTMLIAFMGTLFGCVGAFLLCFAASRNLTSHYLLYVTSRRLLEVARTVPELVFALIFVYAFGLGPLPGVLAIAVHSMGALGKLFAEVNENTDMRPVEGVRAAGGNWTQIMRYAVMPQVLPDFVSYTLLRFEINVRASSVVGFVGAGGIGQELYTVIRQFIYVDISAIVLLLMLTVALIDILCERLRHRLIGAQGLA
jgi:phosphonate transport system permease protein